jgi:hypothetical protein
MRKAHMMCVARLLLTYHPSPARRGKGIGVEEGVWGATGARDGDVRNELRHETLVCSVHISLSVHSAHNPSSFHPDVALRPLRRLLITIGESIPPSTITTRMARAAPASPRYEGEDAGYGEGDEDGDGVGSDVGGALREAYPHEGDEDKTAEMTPTSDVCAHVECARARDVEGGLPHEQQAQVVPHGRSPFRLVPRLPAFYVLLVRLDFFILRTHQVTFSYSHVLLVS